MFLVGECNYILPNGVFDKILIEHVHAGGHLDEQLLYNLGCLELVDWNTGITFDPTINPLQLQ